MLKGGKYYNMEVNKMEKCDLCGLPALYDGRLRNQSAWAFMCPDCFNLRGAGLGLGIGQKLETKPTC